MDQFSICKALIGNDLILEDLIHVECYVHNKIGLFIPSTGPCFYAAKPAHCHPAYMFVIFFSDEGETGYRKSDYDLSNNQDQYLAVAFSPGISYNDFHDGGYYCIMIDKEYFEEQFKKYDSHVPLFERKKFTMCRDILKALNTFAFEYSKKMPNSDITMEAQMTIITHWMIRSLLGEVLGMRAISSNYAVARAEQYIERHFSQKITVKQLAELGNVSVTSFNRLFKKETRKTPMDYLIEIRLEKAKGTLRRKQLSITEIALQCGFSSSSHFTTSFKKLFGVSPTDYRKSYHDD